MILNSSENIKIGTVDVEAVYIGSVPVWLSVADEVYQLHSSSSFTDEGQTVTITLSTENVDIGTSIPYTITGVASDDIDGAPLTGNFVVGEVFPHTFPIALGSEITLNVTADFITEGEETLTLTLDNSEADIDIIINDTSV